jgi:hypothetical protein
VSRWSALFADLEGQAAAQRALERSAEVDQRARAEVGALTVAARLRGSLGQLVVVQLGGGLTLSGRIGQTGPDWTLLTEDAAQEAVLLHRHLVSVRGLGRHADLAAGVVESRLGARVVLRGIARDRSAVRIHLTTGAVVDGTIDRVGGDFMELAAHPLGEQRRRGEVREGDLIPLRAVVAVLRAD